MSGPDVCATTGKRRYHSRRKALVAKDHVLQMQTRWETEKRVARIYRCQHCDGWHLTSRGARSGR